MKTYEVLNNGALVGVYTNGPTAIAVVRRIKRLYPGNTVSIQRGNALRWDHLAERMDLEARVSRCVNCDD